MSNFTQKQITTKAGNDFLLQFPGVRQVTKITDRVKNKFGIASDERLAEEIFAHVVVEPKMKVDDFKGPTGYQELFEVVSAAYAFITGNDEKTDSEKESEEGSNGAE
ncbi:hypothetical protein BK129_01500 [Paenibacillus amylolyticus]|uniref:hypothetical protein n=1 Tax=Paenibacillus amylolyticus TaxID=1451 RepID=UPI00096C7CFD|nr:hypothetical protein [Paenibacillus amylolyticus]OMF09558.1 hypothetical protein BK129_01500 [Paenibacillus amylolyticus]